MIFVVAALLSASVALGVAALPLYLADLGAAPLLSWSALAYGAGLAASALATPLWGGLADRFGRRALLIRAALGLALASVALAAAATPGQVVAARILQGLLSGALPALTALAAATAAPGARAALLGRVESAVSAGAIAGPVLGVACVAAGGFDAVYALCAVLAVAAAVAAVALPESRGATSARGALPAGLGRLLVLAAAIEAGQAIVELCWPVLVVALAPDPVVQAAVVAAVEVAGEGAYLVAAPFVGAVADRRGGGVVLKACLAAGAAFSVLAAAAPSAWWLVPAAAGADGAASGVHPVLQDRLAAGAPGQEGAALAWGASAVRAGGLAGAALTPLLAVLGPAAAIALAALGLLGCAAAAPADTPAPAVEAA